MYVSIDVPKGGLDFDRQAALLNMADVACLRHSPYALFPDLTSRLRSVLSFDVINLAFYDSTRKIMKMSFWEGSRLLRDSTEIPVEQSVVGSVWRNQSPASLNNLATERQVDPESQLLREHDIRSYSVLPLTNYREKLGAIGFGSKRLHGFATQDIEFLHRAAEMIAVCLGKTIDEPARIEEMRRLRLLIEVSGLETHAASAERSVASILESMQKWAMEDYVGIYLYDDALQSLRLHMADSEVAKKMAPFGMTPVEGSLAGQAFRDRRSIVLDHSSLAGLPLASVKRGIELGVKSLYLSPLISEKGPVGVLKVGRREGHGFSSRDIEVLERVAATVAPALEGSRSRIQEKREKPAAKDTTNAMLDSRAESEHANQLQGILEAMSGLSPNGILAWFSAPDALMKSEQFLTAYFKASRVGLCILDTNFHYLAVNETIAEMNGVPPADHLGRSVREVLGDFAEILEPQFRRVLATGQPIADLEISFTLPNRDEPGHWVEHYIPIKDASGEVKQIAAIAVEVTEQKKLEESLRSVSERLRQERKRHEVLMEIGRLLTTKRDMKQVFTRISAYLRRLLRQEYAALALHDEKTGRLVPQAMDFPLGKNQIIGGEIPTEKGAGDKALQEGSPLILSHFEMQEFAPEIAAGIVSEGLKSLCLVPMFRPKGPLGVLVFGSTRADAFHNDDLTFLNQVAAQLAIAIENERSAREVEQLRQRLKQERRYLEGTSHTQPNFEEIIGESSALRQVLDQVEIVSESDATVLILGETGTGKGLIARAIHRTSKRKSRSFVTSNCAAIPTGLLESELFGHEKGAFTGAVSQKIGRLELADMGTLFLDEIGEIPLEMQPKLLRVLQDHEFERLGGTRTITVDLRLIAATNRNLANSVAAREFRSDLFYRLNVFPIRLPALRDRREDIPLLVRHFVQKFSSRMGHRIETIPKETMDAIVQWHWPGNVRELENFIERSVILTDGSALRAPLSEFQAEAANSAEPSLEATEREAIIRVLRETGGIISGPGGAAHRLGLKRTTLQSRMQKLGIARKDYTD